MNGKPQTSFQSLETVKNQCFNALYNYAASARDVALHKWFGEERRTEALRLAGFVKADIIEFKRKLENLEVDFNKLPGKVRQHPHHPMILSIGGKYITYLDDLQTTVGSRVADMIELLTHDIDAAGGK